MAKYAVPLLLMSALFLGACGSKKDANERNFAAAIQQYLEKKGDLCLGFDSWPVKYNEYRWGGKLLQKAWPRWKQSGWSRVRIPR